MTKYSTLKIAQLITINARDENFEFKVKKKLRWRSLHTFEIEWIYCIGIQVGIIRMYILFTHNNTIM